MTKYLYVGLIVVGFLLPSAGYSDFDLEDCYGNCRGMPLRIQFGQIPQEMDIAPMVQGNYESCMQKCDREFWADFDRKTEGIKQKDKGN